MILPKGIRQRFVLTVMSLLLLLTLAVTGSVVHVIRRNAIQTATLGLNRDSDSFKTIHRHRILELYTRARLLAAEPRVIAALGTPDIDRPTVEFLAKEIREDGDLDLVVFSGRGEWPPAVSIKGIERDDAAWIAGIQPGPDGAYRTAAGKDVHIVSAPVTIGGEYMGLIVIGDFVRETHFRILQPLIPSDIILYSLETPNNHPRVMATTLPQLTQTDASSVFAGSVPADTRPVHIALSTTGEDYLVRSTFLDNHVLCVFLKSLAPAQAAAAAAFKTAIAVAAGFLIVSTILVTFMASTVTRPILKLVEGTEAIARGNLNARTDVAEPEELQKLSLSFNSMAMRIQELLRIEEEAKARLEERVKERTAELSELNRLLVQAHQELKDQTGKMILYEKMAGMGTLVAGVAHEMNNPLTVIIGNTEIFYDSITDPRLKKKAGTILLHARRCAEIVKNMLRFARQEEPERTPVDIHLLIDRTLDLARLGTEFDSAQIVKQYDKHLPMIHLDESLIQQVILNIVTNAIQAMADSDRRGTLTIRTCVAGQKILLQFQDEGPGMTPLAASRIFDPFFTTKGVGRGVGLGLSVSLGIVEKHGGRIFVEQTSPAGTTIAVELPILPIPQEERI